ncbi:hypothetical protein GGI03_002879 [Coemansia sp. RSA 2337]|nr:hypothetical protein GGI14_002722 [Coemansia sp. S680]KAJ2054449.1 hypothetical protein GGI08_004589 [Coemansia sp. S2]KAJ2109552.1 hypothetical protein GGI16_000685 [Coemansia sp. S142-1]KAJ2110767.1 hypothetical protein IW146_005764 [Coemansia sp. RSA 922]KAJ2465042.1 hypothetical protein GGI03_002879 [Coemansia sp. RSA 2337]
MNPRGLPRAYTYRHMSQAQSLVLDDLRTATAQLDTSYIGLFLLTASEYWLLLPLFNPVVIFWNTRHYKRLCRATSLPKPARRQMLANLILTSVLGFIPIVNIIFTRCFKCNKRNLAIVESTLQANEDKTIYRKETNSDTLMPAHMEKLFNKSPVFKREQTAPASSNRMSVASAHSACSVGSVASASYSVYSSPRVSISELLRYAADDAAISVHSSSTDDAASTVIDLSDCHEAARLAPMSAATTANGESLEKGSLETHMHEEQAYTQGWLYAPVAYMSSWIWGTAY